MSAPPDDAGLVERLRLTGTMPLSLACQAADRIEALKGEVAALRKRLDLWEPKPYCPPSVSGRAARSLSRPVEEE